MHDVKDVAKLLSSSVCQRCVSMQHAISIDRIHFNLAIHFLQLYKFTYNKSEKINRCLYCCKRDENLDEATRISM